MIAAYCDREILEHVSSRAGRISASRGKPSKGSPFGEESWWSEGEVATECHDCGLEAGSFHHFRCDMEQRPVCHAQLLSCEHGPPV